MNSDLMKFIHVTSLLSSSDPTKFFGCELGAQTQFDTKNDRYIVNGSHEANKLQDMLDGFIRKFVLCAECDNPETDLVNISRPDKLHKSLVVIFVCTDLFFIFAKIFLLLAACQSQETNHRHFM